MVHIHTYVCEAQFIHNFDHPLGELMCCQLMNILSYGNVHTIHVLDVAVWIQVRIVCKVIYSQWFYLP